MKTAVIFDLDGTLIDTEKNASVAVKNCFERWKIKLSPEDSAYVTGKTWAKAFEHLFVKYKLPVSDSEAAKTIQDEYTASVRELLDIVPGGARAVADLARHFPLALVSGSFRSDILWALETLGIRENFRAILGAEDYPRSKPEPDGYLKAMQMLDVSPRETLIFEDSTAGIASARAAGAWVVAITSTNHHAQDHSLAHEEIIDLTRVNSEWVLNFMRRHQK